MGRNKNFKKHIEKLSKNINKSQRQTPSYIHYARCDTIVTRLEGFGMPQIEAGACAKPVIGIKAMGMLDTLIHGKTALLAEVAQEVLMRETILGSESGFEEGHRHIFDKPRTVDYRASVHDIANYLMDLMENPELRIGLGQAARERVVESYDYRKIAKRFVEIVEEKLGRL